VGGWRGARSTEFGVRAAPSHRGPEGQGRPSARAACPAPHAPHAHLVFPGQLHGRQPALDGVHGGLGEERDGELHVGQGGRGLRGVGAGWDGSCVGWGSPQNAGHEPSQHEPHSTIRAITARATTRWKPRATTARTTRAVAATSARLTARPTCSSILASDSAMRMTASSWRTVMGTGGTSLSVASACARACRRGGADGGAGYSGGLEGACRGCVGSGCGPAREGRGCGCDAARKLCGVRRRGAGGGPLELWAAAAVAVRSAGGGADAPLRGSPRRRPPLAPRPPRSGGASTACGSSGCSGAGTPRPGVQAEGIGVEGERMTECVTAGAQQRRKRGVFG
jgi:hypothetical protein